MDMTVLAFLGGVLFVGILLVVVIALTKKAPKGLNIDQYRSRWLTIEQQLAKDEPSSHLLCILNADKLLDSALKDRGFSGQTMGERMKAAQKTWSNANSIWTAHKIRNQIAHENDVKVTYDNARRVLASYKQALKDLGAI